MITTPGVDPRDTMRRDAFSPEDREAKRREAARKGYAGSVGSHPKELGGKALKTKQAEDDKHNLEFARPRAIAERRPQRKRCQAEP
ncbi:hypothetical protein LMG27198_37070 [Methylocystis echinoides]|uniref:Uncharacterized protein n=1 Tax=Methylocystis echinoides TaxID=29468 RepID=A0A9W6LTG6_9HYPH|nr:hypothetical protein LMG27198_37070 [Methylocystis echinoides]